MNRTYRSLGTREAISRRDFINGAAVATGSVLLPWPLWAAETADSDYPPERLGMRGSHPGSFEAGHALRDGRAPNLEGATPTDDVYDLVIVGAGLSGLSAAHFFKRDVGGPVRILLLDNHDDFGGHAKRNELHYQGRTLVLNGGTLEMESPERYNQWALELLKDIGVDVGRYTKANERVAELYRVMGLREGCFFDREKFGTDKLVVPPMPGQESERGHFSQSFVHQMPISDRAKEDLLRLQDLADLPGGQHGRQKEGQSSVHFPDGNATLARLLVRKLIPDSIPGDSQEDIGAARVDYSSLDRPESATRLRLNSMALNIRHDGNIGTATEVHVTYSQGGRLQRVRGKACILACWNMIIPYLAPELPSAQREALAYNVKGPIVYSNVFLRNWKAFEKLGVQEIACPSMYHHSIALAEPCDLGELRHSRRPDEPTVVQMIRTPASPGLPRKEQHRIGRAELLTTSFETFERNIRDQLGRVLGPGGFNPIRDIVGIAVNRWPHGYSYTYNSLYDPLEWVFTETNARPCVIARQPFGRISIANADAAASPHTDAAILEAHRAVEEVLERRAFPFVGRVGEAT